MRRLSLISLGLLAACASPQENCIAGATRDAHVINGLVAETEANLLRGYALQTVVVLEKDWVDCTPPPTEAEPFPAPKMCLADVPVEKTQAVAIDLRAEAAKLDSLRQQQVRLSEQAHAEIAQCQTLYPE
ncbi:MAG: hypothetical protein ACT4N9_06485 [Paracoccaceae bacterium]